jgi:hypothetical protein
VKTAQKSTEFLFTWSRWRVRKCENRYGFVSVLWRQPRQNKEWNMRSERKKLADFQLLFKYTNMDIRCVNVRKVEPNNWPREWRRRRSIMCAVMVAFTSNSHAKRKLDKKAYSPLSKCIRTFHKELSLLINGLMVRFRPFLISTQVGVYTSQGNVKR